MGLYTCSHCGFQANMEQMIDFHVNKVHIERVKQENIETKISKSNDIADYDMFSGSIVNSAKIKFKRKSHILTRKNINCTLCDFVCEFPSSLLKHEGVGCYKYKCPSCPFKTSIRGDLIKHKPAKCKMGNDPEMKGHAVCDQCDYMANTYGQLKLHQANKSCYRYFCKYCPFKTSMGRSLRNHKVYRVCKIQTRPYQIQDPIVNQLQKERYPCTECDYKGASFANLQYHQKGTCYRHKCQHCEFKTSLLKTMKRHEIKTNHFPNRSVTEDFTPGKFICKDCDYEGIEVQMFRYHKRKNNCYRFKCLKCDFKTSLISSFTIHKKTKGNDHVTRKWDESKRKQMKLYHLYKVKIERPKIWHTCENCDYTAAYKHKLEFHKTWGCFRFTCLRCDFKTSLKSKFEAHKEEFKHSQTNVLRWSCSKCDFKTTLKSNLRNHKASTKGCYLFKCKFNCNFKTSMRQEMTKHRIAHGFGDGKTKGEFSCKTCDFQARVLENLSQHKVCYKWTCNVCTFKSSHKRKLKVHRMAEGHKAVYITKMKFSCGKCDFKCADEAALMKHQKVTNKCFKFGCPHCNFKTSLHASKEMHEKDCFKKHEGFNCSKCDFKTDKKRHLMKHKHEGCFPFTCKHCDFKTSVRNLLTIHKQQTHSSYECPNCDYKVKVKTEKEQDTFETKHKTVGCFKFSCLSCDFTTSIPNTMKSHREKSHSKPINLKHGEKRAIISSYKCDKCDYIVRARTEREQTSLKSQHEANGCFKVSCLICNFKTSMIQSMTLHRGKNHNARENVEYYDEFKKSFVDVFLNN